MRNSFRVAAKGIVIAEIICMLLPLTLGLFLAIAAGLFKFGSIIFGSAKFPNMEIAITYLAIAAIAILASYGLFALWWLALNYSKISMRQIPKYVSYGLIVGIAINLIFAILGPWFAFPAGMSVLRNPKYLILPVLPLIVLLTLISIVWLQNRQPRAQ